MARPEIKKIIAKRRKELKAGNKLATTNQEVVRERLAIDTQDKREFLWGLAHECAKTVKTEDVAEHMDEEGTLVRTIVVTESVFRPREAIDAIAALNEMDGDIKTPGGKQDPFGGGNWSIEQALISITQQPGA